MKRQLHLFFSYSLYLLCSQQLQAQAYFQNQATAVGVGDHSGTIYLGGGISFCDYNNDGWDDITIATQSGDPLKIYKNNGDGTYSLETTLNPNNLSQQKQVIWVDIDNDGDKDLYISSDIDGSRLYENDGTSLTDITTVSGLPTAAQSNFGASWGDYNNDGFLDVFLCNRGIPTPQANYLYKNNGDGTFTNVSATAGIDSGSHLSFCSAFFDYNNDGWQDIYMANDKTNTTNILYKNNGDGTFTDVSEESETNIAIDAMSVTIADVDGDSWFDIYVTNGIPGNYLLRNNGDGTFSNIAASTGTMFESVAWGSVFLDAENDGDLDLYVSGSLDGAVPSLLSAAYYSNNGNGTFSMLGSSGFANDTSESYANAIGDTDNDGFPEIIVSNNGGDDIFLWKNQTTSSNNWLKVSLEGVASNKQGIGATIELKSQGETHYRYTVCGEGYISQNSETEFFGIGTNTVIDYVKVTWLGGAQDILYNVTPNQALHIVEGSSPLSTEEFQEKNEVLVYPNPTTGKIWFQISTNETYTYMIFDAKGTEIKKGHIGAENSINLTGLASGYYMIKILGNKGVFNKKIMLK
ncbi:putative secreted protein (Por secretion system target) [Kordia periserrulae]|uniref:Putative secreted protein (Por secretion system target) n=1 Tax=Kordia periserrulae TaxID=701523 RepID=A0A2T6BUG8_9FLAO|nr:FG-GAP-like repeat-containing protein [Kordia periserrulae]PTX59728.1 putative secreted protein (Por secretion system target) [Kordia periserrulae]